VQTHGSFLPFVWKPMEIAVVDETGSDSSNLVLLSGV
jgi:hypothetical protein